MRKIKILTFLALTLTLSGCGIYDDWKQEYTGATSGEYSSNNVTNHLYGSTINAYYRSDFTVDFLFNICEIPFNNQDYGIDYLAAGDWVDITYTGEWVEAETYPSYLASKIDISKIEVTHGKIVEFVVNADKTLSPTNPNVVVGDYLTEYCIDSDLSYHELTTCLEGTHIYGVISTMSTTNEISAFYSYDPSK